MPVCCFGAQGGERDESGAEKRRNEESRARQRRAEATRNEPEIQEHKKNRRRTEKRKVEERALNETHRSNNVSLLRQLEDARRAVVKAVEEVPGRPAKLGALVKWKVLVPLRTNFLFTCQGRGDTVCMTVCT